MLHHRRPVPRRRVLALVIGAGGMLTILLAGIALSVASILGGAPAARQQPTTAVTISGSPSSGHRAGREQPSNLAMSVDGESSVPGEEAPGALSSIAPAPMVLPASTVTGIRGVATGYPQSPEGAVAQLGAIDVAVFLAGPDAAEAILRTWSTVPLLADPRWTVTTAVRQARSQDSTSPHVSAVPVMARVAGVDPPVSHEVCLVLSLDPRKGPPGRAWSPAPKPFTHCELMVWDETHWAIAPGQPTGQPVQVRPGSSVAYEAGYRMLQAATAQDQR